MILLCQQKYDQAHTCLKDLKDYLHSIGLQWELLCATLRLAECLLRQQQPFEALRHINDIALLISRNEYEQTVLKELCHLPSLERAIRTMPQLADLRAILRAETEMDEKHEEPNQPSNRGTAI